MITIIITRLLVVIFSHIHKEILFKETIYIQERLK